MSAPTPHCPHRPFFDHLTLHVATADFCNFEDGHLREDGRFPRVLELMDLVRGRPKLRERFAALASERAEFEEAGPEAVRRARQ